MRLHRFYISEKVGEKSEITLLDHDLIHQILNVFRLDKNDQIIIFDGSGFDYVSQILSLSKKEVILTILEAVNKSPEVQTKNKISLYLSLIKKNNFELAVEKCTELGVSEIHPIISSRSEKKDINQERLEKIVKEASEQCGRFDLPQVFHVTDLEVAVSQAAEEGKTCVVFHTGKGLPTYVSEELKYKSIAVFVGPEGGWSDQEIEIFEKNNFKICRLETNTLRAETAAMISVWSISTI
jgi:16S rRNA (uracil1498-N3)-methyltransferase